MNVFEYSVLKYMPSPKRGEVVNIGIVVFLENNIDVRLINASAKLRLLDGATTIHDLDAYKEALIDLASMAKSKDQAYDFLKTFRGESFISEKACFVLDHINQYDAQVQRLFNDLVKPYSIKETAPKTSRIHTLIKHKFEAMDLLAKGAEELGQHKVVYNYPLNDKTGFTADFLLKNGRYHITEAIDFNVNDVNAKFKETSMKVMAFVEGRKALGDDSSRYFIYSATAEKEREVIAHLNLAQDYSDKVFNLESRQEEAAYFDLIANLAGATLPQFH